MPIKRNGVDKDFADFLDGRLAELESAIVRVLGEVGEDGYETAVNHGTYKNQTGNLRSSIGYGVVKYGQLVKRGGFKVILGGAEGAEKGKSRLNELAAECGRDEIVLIFVAGAEYAAYVEAMGYDVLTFSEMSCYRKASEEINKLLR